ncbi:MAG: amino acid-binding protein [Deltaproteobacteria bacterium]|nr:amino acid-binding protein [Deltaproteobacteria bacterium]
MKLKQITISIENSPGRLYEVTHALGEAGINLRALNLVDTGAFGQLRLLVSDIATTRRILMELQMPAKVNEVVAVEIEDRSGMLAALLKPLKDAGVNVLYTYAFVGFSAGKAVMIFRFSDNDEAIRILLESGHVLLDAEAFGILETENQC